MKIITWNCNMAFRKKAEIILECKPDILVIPECEHPDKLKFNDNVLKPTSILWFGKNQNKGLGIFSYNEYELKLLETYNETLQMVIPIAVSSAKLNFTLYAIWANNPTDPDGQYIEQVWKAIHYYDMQILNEQTILIGDFNSNTIWDKKHRASNHSNVVRHLEEKNIYSTYHKYFNQTQGEEEHSTLYMYRQKSRPYHIDYCFASQDFITRLKNVEIGDKDFYLQYSDHVPVIITFSD